MSWAAHELESYFIQKHTKAKVSYLAILLGCLLPDLATKLPVYGFRIGPYTLKASDPAQYHRGWPGVGFTHSLLFGVVVATVVLAVWRNQAWFLGLILGQWAHVLTDTFDSVGTMLFFPFTTQHYSVHMWAYAAQAGRYGDAAAYYSSLGGVWDFLWLVLAISGWQVFTRRFFFSTVVPNDPVWGWLRRRFGLSDRAMLALYRSYFLYGGCRIFAWFIWSRLSVRAPLDLSWGGPYFVTPVSLAPETWAGLLQHSVVGVGGLALLLYLGWRLLGAQLWARCRTG
ncbi:MAG: metal-dependent hydrolase [Mycobacteriales bacterium]